MPRRPPPRPGPLRAHVASMRGCRSAMTGGRGREGHRRADAGLPERHDRLARSPRAAVARARGCWSAMAGGRRGARPRQCSAAGLLSAPDSNEENQRRRRGRGISVISHLILCVLFFFKSFNQPLNNGHPNQGQTAPSFQNNRGKITKLKK